MSTDADKVRAAADHIERVGLHKGGAYDYRHPSYRQLAADDLGETYFRAISENSVPACTLGAVWAYFDGHSPEGFRTFFRKRGINAINVWNDAPERTADEVVTTLRAFADTLDAQPV